MIGLVLLASALTLDDLIALTRDEANGGLEVCATGIVTQVADWREASGVIARPSDPFGRGIYFSGEQGLVRVAAIEGGEALKQGDLVEVRGVSAGMAFAPGIKASALRKVSRADLQEYPLRRLADLNHGAYDNALMRLRGVCSGLRHVEAARGGRGKPMSLLEVRTFDGVFFAHIPGDVDEWKGLLDAELELAGCAMTHFGLRGDFRGVQLEVAGREGVRVLRQAAGGFDSLDTTSLVDVASYSPGGYDAHARRVRGLVTYCDGGRQFYIQEGKLGARITAGTQDTAGLRRGDEVEVVGFPSVSGSALEMHAISWKVVGKGAMDDCAEDLQLCDFVFWQSGRSDGMLNDHTGLLVRFRARIIHVERAGDSLVLLAMDRGVTAKVTVRGAPDFPFDDVENMRPLAQVTGIAKLTVSDELYDDRIPVARAVEFAVSDPSGIVFVPDPEWRSRRNWRRAKTVMAIAAALLFAAFLGTCALFVRANRRRIKSEAILEERRRMAVDLHDTVEQHLAGIGMTLKSMRHIAPGLPPQLADALAETSGMLAQAKAEIRQTVWNLRSDELFDCTPTELMRRLAKRTQRETALRVRTHLRGLPASLPHGLLSNVVYIVQEAMTNAIKHADARNIAIVSDPCGGGFVLRVLNDGRPFDVDTALGAGTGHFGLSGMRERAARCGIGISWVREDGWTCVRLEVKV